MGVVYYPKLRQYQDNTYGGQGETDPEGWHTKQISQCGSEDHGHSDQAGKNIQTSHLT